MPPIIAYIDDYEYDDTTFEIDFNTQSNEEQDGTLDYEGDIVMQGADDVWRDDFQATMIMDGEREHDMNAAFDVSQVNERVHFLVTINVDPAVGDIFSEQWELFYDPIPAEFDPELVFVRECSTTPTDGRELRGTDAAEIYLEAENHNERAALADFVFWLNGEEIHREEVAVDAESYNFWTHSFLPVDEGVDSVGEITLGGTLENKRDAFDN